MHLDFQASDITIMVLDKNFAGFSLPLILLEQVLIKIKRLRGGFLGWFGSQRKEKLAEIE